MPGIVENHGDMEGSGARIVVDRHRAVVGGVAILGSRADAEAFEVQIMGDVRHLVEGVVVGGIDASEADHLVRVFATVIGNVFVGYLGGLRYLLRKPRIKGAIERGSAARR